MKGILQSQSLWAKEFIFLNDKTEFVYALSALHKAALSIALPKIPSDLRDQTKSDDHIKLMLPDYIRNFKRLAEEADGYGSLYVTSFARGRNEDENERGILTLWDRYTHNEGYCLQFDASDVGEIVELEKERRSYASIELVEVTYGVDENSYEFKKLAEQLSHRIMQYLFQERGDRRLAPDREKVDLDSYFFMKLMNFCGKHKDPAFSDEREVRIFAYPIKLAQGRPFIGIAMSPKVYRIASKSDGHRYIILGDFVRPGIIPKRIMIGPNAKLTLDELKNLTSASCKVAKCNIPIR